MVMRAAILLLLRLSLAALLLVHNGAHASSYRIAIVPKMRAAEAFYGLTREGCHDRAALSNGKLECVYTGSLEPSVEENVRILNELVDDPTIDGIVVSPLDPEAYADVIARSMKAGKPVLTFDSDAPDSARLAYVGTNNYYMGRELAKLLQQIKPDGGTFGVVSGFGDNLAKREQGVRDVLAENGRWIEVENSPKNGFEDTDESLARMWDFTREYDDLGAIVSVVGLPMFKDNTTDWKNFVDSNRNVLTIMADALPIQLQLMQISYVDALVGQLPYNMGYQSADAMLKVFEGLENGMPLTETLTQESIYITHQLEVLRIPLELPFLEFDYNRISKASVVGYVLCALIIGTSIACIVWTLIHRQHQVVQASQPMFLHMICIGTLLMGAAIPPLSMDDHYGQGTADAACMASPWFMTMGFTVAFAALFSKTWRLNKILLSKNPLRRIRVTEKDVILPFLVLVSVNVLALLFWTIFAPLHFVRTLGKYNIARVNQRRRNILPSHFAFLVEQRTALIHGTGRLEVMDTVSESSKAGGSIPYLVIIAVVNITALAIANFQAYLARNTRTEFNESAYIAMANASFLQAVLICLPIIFLTRETPHAYFIVLSVVLFILSLAILACMFVPKMLAVKEAGKRSTNGLQESKRVHISGLNLTGSSGTHPGSNAFNGDPVTCMLQQFQRLSFNDKTLIMKKLSAAHGPPTAALMRESLRVLEESLKEASEVEHVEEPEQVEKSGHFDVTDRVSEETEHVESESNV